MSRTYVPVEPLETIEGRPFTNPVDSLEDLAWLQYMVGTLRQLLGQLEVIKAQPRPFVMYLQESENRYHRIALAHPELLLDDKDLIVVGFCGRKRPDLDRGPIDAVDGELIAAFSQHPYLISYSTLQLPDGNACNLVLFSDYHGLSDWAKGERHAYAANELAPRYYHCIRLHNATLPGGLISGKELVLLRTKYYDYREDAIWLGVRELSKKG
jgi:hypothetical protein